MRKVYQSYDGLVFEDEEECAEHERMHHEEKARKEKLWKVEATVQNVVYFTDYIKKECEKHLIPYSIINVENVNYVVFNFYCATQEKSRIVKQICDGCNAKYFVSESKAI